jgi:hypothetical protein
MLRKAIVTGFICVLAGLFVTAANAQSAKFSAVYDTDDITVSQPVGTANLQEMDLATIRVPQNKEILITLSGEVNIVTFTAAKGKNTTAKVTSSSKGEANVTVKYASSTEADVCSNGTEAKPGTITMASREQTLSVDVTTTDLDDLDAVIEVLVELELDTTAAHTFQFLAPNVDAGEYKVAACWDLTATGADGDQTAMVVLQNRIMTLQEVRAVNSAENFIDVD